jgi:hypothetical protein
MKSSAKIMKTIIKTTKKIGTRRTTNRTQNQKKIRTKIKIKIIITTMKMSGVHQAKTQATSNNQIKIMFSLINFRRSINSC